MTRISQRGDVVTLINVFTVAPEDQQRLLDLLVDATESVMRELPASYRPIYTRASTVLRLPTTPSGEAGRTSRRCSRTPRRLCI